METFAWDNTFVTGLPTVDAQHRDLVNLFNELNEHLFRGDAQREGLLHATFDRLVAYTQTHFRDEEALMRQEGVDPRHAQVHQQLHQQFVEQIGAMWARHASMRDPAETFIGFLTAWLGLHILGIDQSMARQIHRIRQGQSPAEAFDQEQAGQDYGTQALLRMIGKLYNVLSLQNSELAQANQHLEERVAQRTRELAQANDELRRANGRLEEFARIDGLLQIANRKHFDERLAQASASAFRRQEPLGVLMIDADDFKRYNDAHGHQAGDACLVAVAGAVGRALHRSTDLLARYGGEELAVILPDTDADGVRVVAQRVVAAVAALGMPHPKSRTAPYVTVSVGGTSRVPATRDGGAALLAEADQALYRAKAEGRNRWLLAPSQPDGLPEPEPAAT